MFHLTEGRLLTSKCPESLSEQYQHTFGQRRRAVLSQTWKTCVESYKKTSILWDFTVLRVSLGCNLQIGCSSAGTISGVNGFYCTRRVAHLLEKTSLNWGAGFPQNGSTQCKIMGAGCLITSCRRPWCWRSQKVSPVLRWGSFGDHIKIHQKFQ